MTHSTLSRPYDPNRLLDLLSASLGTSSDARLSKVLRLSPEVIGNIRAGRVAIRPSLLVSMAESAGKSVEELRFILGDRRRKARMACRIHHARSRHGESMPEAAMRSQ